MKPVRKYVVLPCDCGSRSFEKADPIRCVDCGTIPPSVQQTELLEETEVNVAVLDR